LRRSRVEFYHWGPHEHGRWMLAGFVAASGDAKLWRMMTVEW
jgi:hypothetical protein